MAEKIRRTPDTSRIEGIRQDLTETQRDQHRDRSREAFRQKRLGKETISPPDSSSFPKPLFRPEELMPQLPVTGFTCLSLFSGGGGLDLGFERAGFKHVGSWEVVEDAGRTLKENRPSWEVHFGKDGDVKQANWKKYHGKIDVLHGGPPCQPFSSAGRQLGKRDPRDMWPEFVRAVIAVQPKVFVAENVSALAGIKFEAYRELEIFSKVRGLYSLSTFTLRAEDFGVPQSRKRYFIVGLRNDLPSDAWRAPEPTHCPFGEVGLVGPSTMGVREALGLPDIGFDSISPTIRCSWTGPRGTTSILSSASAAKTFEKLAIWPNGVAPDRGAAAVFPAKNSQYRLSVEEVSLLQGFPSDWKFQGATYMKLGQIGNSVAPPMAYNVAKAVRQALSS